MAKRGTVALVPAPVVAPVLEVVISAVLSLLLTAQPTTTGSRRGSRSAKIILKPVRVRYLYGRAIRADIAIRFTVEVVNLIYRRIDLAIARSTTVTGKIDRDKLDAELWYVIGLGNVRRLPNGNSMVWHVNKLLARYDQYLFPQLPNIRKTKIFPLPQRTNPDGAKTYPAFPSRPRSPIQ